MRAFQGSHVLYLEYYHRPVSIQIQSTETRVRVIENIEAVVQDFMNYYFPLGAANFDLF